jgi:hypothetical protein
VKTPVLIALIASVPVGAIAGMLFKFDARARKWSRRSAFLFIAVGSVVCCAGMSALVFVLGGFQSETGWADPLLSSVATPAPTAPAADTATLTWVAPRTKADGSALRDLAGFRIYYGTVSGSYSASITVSNPAATTYTVRALPAGTYYFVVKAYDKRNVESAPSAEVSKTIRQDKPA